MKLEDLEAYKLAMELGERAWDKVLLWGYFERSTLGKQLVRAADSISLNLAEANGRYFFKERLQFYFYSRGSAFETKSCIKKAMDRGLILKEDCELLIQKLDRFVSMINAIIRSVRNNLNNP